MKDIWTNLCANFSSDSALIHDTWQIIEEQYSESNRSYHNLEHLSYMLNEFEKHKAEIQDKESILFSIFLHDLIYNVERNDNEELSAEKGIELLEELQLPKKKLKKIHAQIMATKTHKSNGENDIEYLLDFDLGVLGESEIEYKKYSKGIREEYKKYPDIIYRIGRKKVLKKFLERDFIYANEKIRREKENQARKNIKNELKEL